MSSNESKTRPSRRTVLKLAGVGASAAMLSRASRVLADRRAPELHTRFSRHFGLRVPLASAGMAFVGLTDLTSAVSNAGALGVYGVGPEPPPVVAARIQAIREQTSGPFGVDFIVASSPLGEFTTQDHIDVVSQARVPIVVFHWNLPTQVWVTQLRAAGAKVFIQTGDVAVALQGVALGVDGVIAQGRSAGGHNRNSTISTLRVVEMMRRALPREIFILAAGGISDGRSLVRAIRAGADGGWAGTVFVAAEESYAHDGYKARLIAAHSPETTTFTTVLGPEFPDAQQRVLRNHATANPDATTPPTIGTTLLFPGVLNVPYTMPLHSAIVPTRDTQGDLGEMDMPAGAVSVRAVRRVRPAADIVEDFIAGAREAIERDDRDDRSLDDD
ncbi:MAG TPA: nitronate monooxygenase [Gemmatimonadaceae bacterium]